MIYARVGVGVRERYVASCDVKSSGVTNTQLRNTEWGPSAARQLQYSATGQSVASGIAAAIKRLGSVVRPPAMFYSGEAQVAVALSWARTSGHGESRIDHGMQWLSPALPDRWPYIGSINGKEVKGATCRELSREPFLPFRFRERKTNEFDTLHLSQPFKGGAGIGNSIVLRAVPFERRLPNLSSAGTFSFRTGVVCRIYRAPLRQVPTTVVRLHQNPKQTTPCASTPLPTLQTIHRAIHSARQGSITTHPGFRGKRDTPKPLLLLDATVQGCGFFASSHHQTPDTRHRTKVPSVARAVVVPDYDVLVASVLRKRAGLIATACHIFFLPSVRLFIIFVIFSVISSQYFTMSLIEQSNPPRGQREQLEQTVYSTERSADTYTEQSRADSKLTPKEDPLQVLVDADEEQCHIEEATILNTKDLKTKKVIIEPPAIPKRNTLRTSRLLDSLRLDSIESATKSLNTTHNVYLSSEEDASSSADEYSDDEYESSGDEAEQSPSRRKSQEITARAVSVIFVGKPCIVELANSRRSISPVKRPQSEFFGRSVSTPFRTGSPLSRPEYPSRKASLASMGDLPKESPSFLSQDPFSKSPYTIRESGLRIDTSSPPKMYPRVPMTPTGAFQRIQKTINLARKRSRPNLKAAAENSASMSSLNLPSLNASQESQESINRSETAPPAVQSSMTYNEVFKASRRNSIAASAVTSAITQASATNSVPASPMTPVTAKRSLLSGLNMNRRRSMKIRR
ncbi:hypothetical protein NUW58_g3193 [Xylaria curta]|uniref:Uncharacterized protein n=1 Tax=Xylaria curta TaxID=42375 RepID=A0ACC1PDM7_9PEZI|nr:hypothetical protein NUW58_g3193 [Xylaria curta]